MTYAECEQLMKDNADVINEPFLDYNGVPQIGYTIHGMLIAPLDKWAKVFEHLSEHGNNKLAVLQVSNDLNNLDVVIYSNLHSSLPIFGTLTNHLARRHLWKK